MKKLIMVVLLLAPILILKAQDVPYHVAFDLTSKDTNDHKMVVRWLTGISSEKPDAKLEVVLYGQSLDMIRKDKSVVAAGLAKLANNKNIAVKVCAVAMKHHGLKESDLLPNIGIVPDGIYELVVKQSEGWGYIKVGH